MAFRTASYGPADYAAGCASRPQKRGERDITSNHRTNVCLSSHVTISIAFLTVSSFHNYIDVVHRQMPLIDTTEFLHETAYATLHQHQALKYAVAMAGAGARNTTLHLEHQYYVAARFHLEMAEMHMGNSSFLNLETAQTLILIARYEFTRTDTTRAIITMARLMQLVRLLELDNIDRRRTQNDPPQNIQKIHGSRNTLWIAYAFYCHASTIFARCEPIDIETVCIDPQYLDSL